MALTRIKICGVRDAGIARVAADAGADAIGLVFVAGTPRQVSIEQAEKIVAALPAFVEPVGLFVDQAIDSIRETSRAVGLSTVQLHGRESPGVAAQLAPLRVIKAVPFDRDVCASLARWRGAADNLAAILLDTPQAAGGDGGGLPGGGGRPFNWSEAARLKTAGGIVMGDRIILAGGLSPDNVSAAIKQVRPYAVDVSSGVESSRGVKDPDRIAAFCNAVRRADGE